MLCTICKANIKTPEPKEKDIVQLPCGHFVQINSKYATGQSSAYFTTEELRRREEEKK